MVVIAIEQGFPKELRIVVDDLAPRILPLAMRAFLLLVSSSAGRSWMIRSSEKRAPGLWGGMLCRKRYIDDCLVEAAAGIDAVVNLGAGFDTRAYRLGPLAALPVWEVDQPENVAAKLASLQRVLGAVPGHVKLVPVDFDREDLGAALASKGYSPSMRTFFVLEGVTQYLTRAGIDALFAFLSRAAPGSRLAFTYVRKDFVEGRVLYGQELGYKKWVAKGKMWFYGMDPEAVPDFLAGYGWRVIEHLGIDDMAERYIKPTGRALASTPIERIVYAARI
jgi:methyltransferase (TIGR00027 family)